MKSSEFRAITAAPLNGSPTPSALMRAHATRVEDFFVRNHGAPPGTVDAEGAVVPWSLRVTGLVRTPLELSGHTLLASPEVLAYAPRVAVSASLQCAGNRRRALQAVRPIPNELPWENEAIGNAVWEGVRLADVLRHAHVLDGAAHVWFTGADVLNGRHEGHDFGASIPIAKALDPSTIIADRMNGAPLMADHGAPMRVVVPGYVGARSVKWLSEIRVERDPTPNHFQRAYSVGDTVLDEFPVSCAFGDPADSATVASGVTRVRGWSIGGGDNVVEQVEVSADDGATWQRARFISPAERHVWRLWEAECTLQRGTHRLVCRATDSAGNTQPDSAASTWNVKGYLNNCWDRITVHAA